mmetsp:Transcript_84230/g.257217  ORF Transcript_84230/g.257217 Transcript_84230/m.257217 type:complete len:429 (+) Transcript_84230:237-1523(+)
MARATSAPQAPPREPRRSEAAAAQHERQAVAETSLAAPNRRHGSLQGVHAFAGHRGGLALHLREEGRAAALPAETLDTLERLLGRFPVPLPPLGLKPLGQVAHAARGVVRVQEEELGGEHDELQHGLPQEGQVRLPVHALAVVRGPRRVKSVDDEVGRQPAQQRNACHPQDSALVEAVQRLVDDLGRGRLREGVPRADGLRELVRVLDRLASALPQVRHHRVHRVADEDDAAVRPGPEELGPPVVQVPLLHGFDRGGVQHLEDLARPALVQGLEVRDDVRALLRRAAGALPRVAGLLRARREGQEGVPLDPSVAHVRRDEVTPWADVDLVAALVIVAQLHHRLACEDCVTRVGAPLNRSAIRGLRLDRALFVHLGADGRPDAVRADEDVGLCAAAVLELDGDPSLVVLVADHWRGVLDEVGLQRPALV